MDGQSTDFRFVETMAQNAASVPGLMLATEVMITEKPEKKEEASMPPGGDMDDDMN